jgi:hypothetical protein
MNKPTALPDMSLQEQEQRQDHSSEESFTMERPRTPDDTDTTNDDDEERPSTFAQRPETARLTEAHPNQRILTRNVRHFPRLERILSGRQPLPELSASCRSSSSTMDHGQSSTRNDSSRHELVSHALSEALKITEQLSSRLALECKQEQEPQ